MFYIILASGDYLNKLLKILTYYSSNSLPCFKRAVI